MATLLAILSGLGQGLVDLVQLPWTIWQWFNMEVLKEKMVALTLAGQSLDFLYMMASLVLLLLFVSLLSRRFLIGTVLALEGLNRKVGQFAAWFVLLLMFQQVLIIVMGQVFRGNELLISPFGMQLSNAELQWLSGQLKLYNAILIAFASAYTFIEGGHVRVDLIYGNLGYRAKRLIDFIGSIVFMLPATVLLWWFAWPLATNAVFAQRPMNIFSTKASWRGVRLESSGTAEFSWVWCFKILILFFAALLFIQAVAFMLRNLWALLSRDEEIESHPKQPDDVLPLTRPDIDLGADVPLEGTAQLLPSGRSRVGEGQSTLTSSAAQKLASAGVSSRKRRRVVKRKSTNPGRKLSSPSLAPAGGPNPSRRGR